MNGFQNLGAMLAGGGNRYEEAAYGDELLKRARTDEVLARARTARDEAIMRERLGDEGIMAAALEGDPTALSIVARSGIDFANLGQGSLRFQEHGLRDTISDPTQAPGVREAAAQGVDPRLDPFSRVGTHSFRRRYEGPEAETETTPFGDIMAAQAMSRAGAADELAASRRDRRESPERYWQPRAEAAPDLPPREAARRRFTESASRELGALFAEDPEQGLTLVEAMFPGEPIENPASEGEEDLSAEELAIRLSPEVRAQVAELSQDPNWRARLERDAQKALQDGVDPELVAARAAYVTSLMESMFQ